MLRKKFIWEKTKCTRLKAIRWSIKLWPGQEGELRPGVKRGKSAEQMREKNNKWREH